MQIPIEYEGQKLNGDVTEINNQWGEAEPRRAGISEVNRFSLSNFIYEVKYALKQLMMYVIMIIGFLFLAYCLALGFADLFQWIIGLFDTIIHS